MFKKIFSNQKNYSSAFERLNNAKEKSVIENNNKISKYEDLFDSALLNLANFLKNNLDKNSLALAIDKFIMASEVKKKEYKPYYYLSYISYLCNDIKLALKYIEIAEMILPDSNKIKNLKSKINLRNK